MTTKEIIQTILDREGLTASSFAKSIGITPTQIYDLQSGKIKKISSGVSNKISSRYPHYSLSWLQTGEMPIYTNQESEVNAEAYENSASITYVPLVNIDSVGGIHSLNSIDRSEQYVERMIPLPDARPGDVAIMQSGNSMAPTIPAGAILQIRQVQGWREYFGYGSDFVLWLTDERRITKQVLKYEPDPKNYVTCHSYNPEAADEELPKAMIKQVWKVVNVLINKGW